MLDDRLAQFTLYPGRLLDASTVAAYTALTVDRCAELCHLDQTCKSFDFKATYALLAWVDLLA